MRATLGGCGIKVPGSGFAILTCMVGVRRGAAIGQDPARAGWVESALVTDPPMELVPARESAVVGLPLEQASEGEATLS